MAKLLQLSRPSARVRSVVRTWWAIRSQKRRRVGGGVLPNAPVIYDGWSERDEFEPDWGSTWIAWTFDPGAFPIGTFEVWCQWGVHDQMVATVSGSDRELYRSKVCQGEEVLYYRVRYVNGSVVGPFSNVFRVDVTV